MATAKNGLFGPISGKIGNTYYYVRNGKQELRAAPHIQKPRTEKQLASEQRMSVLSPFLNRIKLYIRIGFQLAAERKGILANQAAKSYNLKHAIKGEYPNQEVDYSAVRLSEGNLAEPLHAVVLAIEEGFKFTWDYDNADLTGNRYDKTMLMAFFPDNGWFCQMIDGAQRIQCEELLLIESHLKGKEAETYISFITDDRSQISNSVYTGRVLFKVRQ